MLIELWRINPSLQPGQQLSKLDLSGDLANARVIISKLYSFFMLAYQFNIKDPPLTPNELYNSSIARVFQSSNPLTLVKFHSMFIFLYSSVLAKFLCQLGYTYIYIYIAIGGEERIHVLIDHLMRFNNIPQIIKWSLLLLVELSIFLSLVELKPCFFHDLSSSMMWGWIWTTVYICIWFSMFASCCVHADHGRCVSGAHNEMKTWIKTIIQTFCKTGLLTIGPRFDQRYMQRDMPMDYCTVLHKEKKKSRFVLVLYCRRLQSLKQLFCFHFYALCDFIMFPSRNWHIQIHKTWKSRWTSQTRKFSKVQNLLIFFSLSI